MAASYQPQACSSQQEEEEEEGGSEGCGEEAERRERRGRFYSLLCFFSFEGSNKALKRMVKRDSVEVPSVVTAPSMPMVKSCRWGKLGSV